MSFPIALVIMLIAGIAGGTVNYLLPSNAVAQTAEKIRGWWACIVLGIGATILVPLFLEIAQSRLLDDIHLGYAWQKSNDTTAPPAYTATTATTPRQRSLTAGTAGDSTKKDTANPKPVQPEKATKAQAEAGEKNTEAPLKYYFLFMAYCFVAAAAGTRFINGIIDTVLKDKTIKDQKKTIAKSKEEIEQEKKAKEEAQKKETAAKEAAEKVAAAKEAAEKAAQRANTEKVQAEKNNTKLTAMNRAAAIADESELANVAKEASVAAGISKLQMPVPIKEATNLDDPQKGRFGGEAESNGRLLRADVQPSRSPGFYKVTLWVETTDTNRPLRDEVTFYLHDSFRPTVDTVKPEAFTNGKAIYTIPLPAYGAFTVGAVTDRGQTLLELDLAEQPEFPKEFRER